MMKAVVMAGGSGLRLRPLTLRYPKSMALFLGKPILAHVLDLLKYHHFSEVVITVKSLADQIQRYFGDGSRLGMTIHYAVEETPLGTAGSVKNAQPYLDNATFLVMSGDVITDIDLASVVRFHREKQASATLALKRVANPQEYGLVVTDAHGRIRHYVEKPSREQVVSNTVNTGIYILEPAVPNDLEPNVAHDFSYDVFPCLLSRNAPLLGYIAEGYWCDIGTLQTYMKARADVVAGKVRHFGRGHHGCG